jgi:phage replication initiation protein
MSAAEVAPLAPRASRAHRGAASPRPVTRGENPSPADEQVGAKVDWLNATFTAPSCSMEAFVAILGKLFRRPVSGIQAGGRLGFAERVDLMARVGSRTVAIGCVAHGGSAQAGRWLLQLTGVGCQFVPDWADLRDLLEQLDARITRLDLAVDLLHGEYTVDDARDWHGLGGFQASGKGRPPSTSFAGDWDGLIKGRTYYVGNSTNGKCLRVYEKGKQLGEPDSEWVRFEVQFGNRDRVIPFEALTDRDAFFAGAYPALQEVVSAAARVIETTRTGGEVTLAHLLHHLRRCYGKLIDVLSSDVGATSSALVQEVRIVGIPRRLNPSSVEAGVAWADVSARLKVLQ